MGPRRHPLLLCLALLAALCGPSVGALASGGAAASEQASVPLHLEIDLAAARAGDAEFMRVLVEERSGWLYPSVIPENSAYCLGPDVIGDRCLVEPHTLVLQLSLANLTSDRILDASFGLDAPGLALLESRGPRYVPGDGWYLPFASLRYTPGALADGPHRIEVGLLQPRETRRVYLRVAFPEPPAPPDLLGLELLAEAVEVPVEEEEFLTRISFEPGRALSVPPRDSAPGVELTSYNAGQGGTLEVSEVAAPGLLADLPPNLRQVAPLYQFRIDGLRDQVEALFPLDFLEEAAEARVVCAAVLSGGQWTVTPAEPRGSAELAVGVSSNRFIGDRTAGPRDRFVTLVVPEAPDGGAEACS